MNKLYLILIFALIYTNLAWSQWSSSSSVDSTSTSTEIDGVRYMFGLSSNGSRHIAFQYNFTSQYAKASYINLRSNILGLLSCDSSSMSIVHQNGTGIIVKSIVDYNSLQLTDVAKIYVGSYDISPQNFGYDPISNKAYFPILSSTSLQVWSLDFTQSSTSLIPLYSNIVKKGQSANFVPKGVYDPTTSRYYVLFASNNVYYLGIYNTKNKNTSNNVIMFLPATLQGDIIVINSKLYVLFNDNVSITMYIVDPTKNMSKKVAVFDNSQSEGYTGNYFAVSSNRIVLFTNVNGQLNTATFIVYDPSTGLFDEFFGWDEMGAFSHVDQICVN
ncbi:hypothetical protein CYY_005715 [Polysphondylium violaceum]|uniref:Uncharacterized protein n=1 Tax=Polysphondylium violaceum TaxID=133409 RepID=A0A8J4UYK2_9MYCE|nr:hypothetical protein CYY_005715 [Polysphondylium violaceum]